MCGVMCGVMFTAHLRWRMLCCRVQWTRSHLGLGLLLQLSSESLEPVERLLGPGSGGKTSPYLSCSLSSVQPKLIAAALGDLHCETAACHVVHTGGVGGGDHTGCGGAGWGSHCLWRGGGWGSHWLWRDGGWGSHWLWRGGVGITLFVEGWRVGITLAVDGRGGDHTVCGGVGGGDHTGCGGVGGGGQLQVMCRDAQRVQKPS